MKTWHACLLAAALIAATGPAAPQSFSCRIGTQPACLDYGDTVCSSRGMCVDRDAACFDRYQCDYEGFTCRSNVTECVDDYEELLRDHNALVDDYNDLLITASRLRDENDQLARQVRDLEATMFSLRNAFSDLEDDLTSVEACVLASGSVREAGQCF